MSSFRRSMFRDGARLSGGTRVQLDSTFPCYSRLVNGGDLVYLARTRAGLSQAELGERAGMAQNAVSRIERGEVDAGFATVRELIRACGFEPQISLAARDSSYARDVRRRRELSPRERLDRGVHLAHVAQSTRHSAAAQGAPAPTARRRHVSGERRGEWHDWPFEPLAVLRAFRDRDVEYILIGGVAAILQGSPLPTYDTDVALAPGAQNRTRLLAALADLDATALTEEGTLPAESFYTPSGHVDVYGRPAGFASYAELRRGSRAIQLEPDLVVQASSLRDIIRSRLAAGDDRQLPALEAALKLESGS